MSYSLKKLVNAFFISILFLAFSIVHAQEEFKRIGDGKIAKSRIIKNMNDVSVIQTTLYFQNITKRGIYKTERNALGLASKSGGNAVSGELKAYLVFKDAEPTEEEYQDLADYFYTYLNQQLEKSGIKTTDWNTFASSELFEFVSDKKAVQKDDEDYSKKGNAWKLYSANNGPRAFRYNPMNNYINGYGVRGITKFNKYMKQSNVKNTASLSLIIDFADIFLDGDAHSGTTKRTFSTVTTKSASIKYSLNPQIRITSRQNGGSSVFVMTDKGKMEEFYLAEDIYTANQITASTSQNKELLKKNKLFSIHIGQNFDIEPFVVEVSKEDYINQVKEALEKYANILVMNIESAKK